LIAQLLTRSVLRELLQSRPILETYMIDTHEFAQKQLELTAEFDKYLFDHPEADESFPDGAHVYFEIAGEHDFNHYSRQLAERQQRDNGATVVLVRVKGLAPPQGSRLIEPIIEQELSSA
jgi:hypothetical protein